MLRYVPLMSADLTILPMTPLHAPDVARVHAAAFPGYFLTRLGPSFLSQMYRRLAQDPQAAAVVAQYGDEVVGFAAGVLDRREFTHTFVLDCWPVLAACLAMRSVSRPGIAWDMACRVPRLLRGGRARGAPVEAATLLSIGVLPEFHSQGIGRRVISACADQLRDRGARRLLLETDVDNAASNAFYRRCGFRLHRRVRLEVSAPWLSTCSIWTEPRSAGQLTPGHRRATLPGAGEWRNGRRAGFRIQ